MAEHEEVADDGLGEAVVEQEVVTLATPLKTLMTPGSVPTTYAAERVLDLISDLEILQRDLQSSGASSKFHQAACYIGYAEGQLRSSLGYLIGGH